LHGFHLNNLGALILGKLCAALAKERSKKRACQHKIADAKKPTGTHVVAELSGARLRPAEKEKKTPQVSGGRGVGRRGEEKHSTTRSRTPSPSLKTQRMLFSTCTSPKKSFEVKIFFKRKKEKSGRAKHHFLRRSPLFSVRGGKKGKRNKEERGERGTKKKKKKKAKPRCVCLSPGFSHVVLLCPRRRCGDAVVGRVAKL
jgi:hypothetical protein